MKKAWSITTTVRNPERLRDFLIALKPLDNQTWNNSSQEEYQKTLIQHRLYGYGNPQFYSALSKAVITTINNPDIEIDSSTIEEIIKLKNYTDFAMRGRQSINPLTKFGFVIIKDGKIHITELGHLLIASDKDAGDVFLRSFIKWQIPNPASSDFSDSSHYNIVPFVATLKLIYSVNKLEIQRGNKPVGISKREFSLFVPSLTKYTEIDSYATKIVKLRDIQKNKSKEERKSIRDSFRQEFAENYLGTSESIKVNKFLKNLKDYGDNAIRYFRLTKFICIRGNGYYIDLEPNRQIEIKTLLDDKFYQPRHFTSKSEYLSYMSDNTLPVLPWHKKEHLTSIVNNVMQDIISLQNKLSLPTISQKNTDEMSVDNLSSYIDDLREIRKGLQEKENHLKSQPSDSISKYIYQLENIYKQENRSLMLEYLSTLALHALNDAIKIKPNYPVGDDNEPTSTAPGGTADIECLYESFSMICEVTMLRGRDQWFNEGQPVMRHLRDFENMHQEAYCIFIAPTIHPDSSETFYIANTFGYKGAKQKIAPLTIKQFIQLLKTLKSMRDSNKQFKNYYLKNLIQTIAGNADQVNNSDDWIANTQGTIDAWSTSLLT